MQQMMVRQLTLMQMDTDSISEVFEEAPSDGLDVDITDLTAAVVGKEAEFLLSDVLDSDGNQMFTALDYVVVNDATE